MWLGTQYGLNRFDGYRFKWFTREKNGLLSNQINHILKDKAGLLWLIETESSKYSIKNLTLFDPFNHEVQTLEEKFKEGLPFHTKDIIGFDQRSDGALVFLSNKNQLLTYTDSWNVYPVDIGTFSKFHRIRWTAADQFWITLESKAKHQNLLILDAQAKLLQQYRHSDAFFIHVYQVDKNGSGKFFNSYNDIHQKDQRASLFQIDEQGKQRIDTSSILNSIKEKIYAFGPNSHLLKTQDHYWIFGDERNFSLIDKKSGQTIALLNNQSPNFETTTQVYLDNSKAVWVATQFGVYRLQLKKSPFKNYLNHQNEKGYNNLFACRQICTDQNNHLWARTENPQSVWKVDLESGLAGDISTKYSELPKLPALNNTNYAIFQNSSQDIFYSASRLIYRVNPITHEYLALDSHLSERGIWGFYEDRNGNVWFYDQRRASFGYIDGDTIITIEEKLTETERPYIYQFFETEQADTVLLVSSAGLFSFDLNTAKTIDRYWSKGKGNFYFTFDNIYHIYRARDHTLWLATGGYGLVNIQFSADSIQILQQYTRADGLPDNTIYAVYPDEFENLWMSSDYGIVQFNKKTKRFKAYTEKDGIAHNEFNRVSHHQDKEGRIYFGGLNGITSFDPKQLVSDTLSSEMDLRITQFEQFDIEKNKLVDKLGAIRSNKSITLKPGDRFFRLEFVLLNYEETDKSQYAYRIEGIDQDWNYQKENTLRISRLPFGQYILRIKGQAANGQRSANEIVIKINVLKPFYLQLWFLLTVFISLLVGAITFFRWRLAQLTKRQKELEQTVAKRTKEVVEERKIIEEQNKILESQTEALKSLEKLKSRFFANVSHELRTPLTLMLGPVHSLLKRMKSDSEEIKLLQFVQRNGRQLQKLINEILDLSKLEANKLEVLRDPVDFYPYLEEQLAQFSSAASSEEQHFEFIYEADKTIRILLDKSKFEKIIHNFLSNAIKFTPALGKITLKVIDEGKNMLIQVIDSGKGIHSDDLPYIFDRFYQSKQADAKTEGGTGIGLSLCKELAELLGGQVWAVSQLGKGSIFYFKFPKSIVPELPPESIQLANQTASVLNDQYQSEPPITRQKAKLLIIEDNADLRAYLSYLLADYDILTAEHGQKAMEILYKSQSPPDLIISDLMMPVMDGFALLERLKSNDSWRHLPVIMLTAKANIRSKLKALRVGVDDYLLKPFQEEELLARIENLLLNYRERMNVFKTIAHSEEQNTDDNKPVISQADSEWLEKVEHLFETNIKNNSFSIEIAASTLYLSIRQLQRRLKQLTGLTPKQYLQELRLQKAKDYLISGKYKTVKETAFATGFKDVQYFSSSFQRHFATTPSSYLS